jgi:pre-rRNA-processing protein TSR3
MIRERSVLGNDGAAVTKLLEYPATLVIYHPRERRAKCTAVPLTGRQDVTFRRYRLEPLPDLTEYFRLGFSDSPAARLTPADASRGLLILDGTWRLVQRMERDLTQVPVRSLPHLETAYPRVSKLSADPPGGLATVEAIFVAYLILGRSLEGLLDHYRWSDEFLQKNQRSFAQLRA